MIEPNNPDLSIGKQCKRLSISRSSFYYTPKGETALNLMLMRQIDEQFLETPFFGVRRILQVQCYLGIQAALLQQGQRGPGLGAARIMENSDGHGGSLR